MDMNMVVSLIFVLVFGGSVIGQEHKANTIEQNQDYKANQNDSLSIFSEKTKITCAVINVKGESNSINIENADTKAESCDNSETAQKNRIEIYGEHNQVNITQSGESTATTIRQRGNSNQISITQKTK